MINDIPNILPLSDKFLIFIDSDIGSEKLRIKIHQKVLRGQPLIFSDRNIVPVHAPTSGYIEDISLYPNPFDQDKKKIKIVIVSDYLDRWIRLKPIKNYKKFRSEELIQIIHQSGVVGLGGGEFSSAKKLMFSMNRVHTLIVNAVESEPYITSDNCLINNYIDQILEGCKIITWIVKIKIVLIAIQENKIQAISKISSSIKNKSFFKLCIIKNKYPGGSSKVLVKSLTGKEIPFNKHSIDIGYLIFNIATIYAIKRAVINGEPLTERIITFLSDKNVLSGNFWTRIGTPIKSLPINQKYNIFLDINVYFGGFFMGKRIWDLNYSILKNTSCISIQLKKMNYKDLIQNECIRCGYCSFVCPVNLLPQQLYWYSKNRNHEKTREHNILDCIECKACEKICPSYIPLVNYFEKEKNIITNIELENNFKKESFFRFINRKKRLSNDRRITEKNSINSQISFRKEKKTDDIKKNIRKKEVEEAIKRIKNKLL